MAQCPELPWSEAHKFCESHGAHLVVLNSEQESSALTEWLDGQGKVCTNNILQIIFRLLDINNPFWTGIIGLGEYLEAKSGREKRSEEILPYQCVLDKKEGFRCFNPGEAITICETPPTETSWYHMQPK